MAARPAVGAPGFAPRLEPPPYGHPPVGYAPAPPVNGFAVASLVLGIVGLCTYGLAGILALVFGLVAMKQIREGGQSGHGLAVAGVTLGSIGLALGILFLMVVFAGVFY